jgi:hypothetical protein
MKQKIKIYRMSIARVFPATHPRAGESTHFLYKIKKALRLDVVGVNAYPKLHTIRAIKSTGKTWTDKIREVLDGKAVLVVYQWDGKPYSKDGCSNLFVFGTGETKNFIDELMKSDKYKCAIPVINSRIGVQKAYINIFYKAGYCITGYEKYEFGIRYDLDCIAKNDGLSECDFQAWFKDYDLNKHLEIIHFTKFRY